MFVIAQDGMSVVTTDLDSAFRIARRSLDTGKGAVEIMRQVGKGKTRLIATLTQKDRVAEGERWG